MKTDVHDDVRSSRGRHDRTRPRTTRSVSAARAARRSRGAPHSPLRPRSSAPITVDSSRSSRRFPSASVAPAASAAERAWVRAATVEDEAAGPKDWGTRACTA